DAVAQPEAFGGGLIAGRRPRRQAAHPVGRAVVCFQPGEDRAKRRWSDAVTLALELDALEAAACLVHLKECDQRNAANWDIAQYDPHIAVAKVERPRKQRGPASEMTQQRNLALAPKSAIDRIGDPAARCCQRHR